MQSITVQGVDVPALGFGTSRMNTDDERRRVIGEALDAGFRHIDTAQSYGSEDAVGDAIRDADVEHEDLFITTKLDRENRAHADVVSSTRDSLDALGIPAVDLLLIHTPNDDVSHEETLNAMNDLRDDGLVENVGVSNFSVEQTREAMALSRAPILTNQVKYNVSHRQDDLLAFCIEKGVLLTAYSPLGFGSVLDDETLVAIGERYGKTPAQVAIRWFVQQPMVTAIPTSTSAEHIHENIDVFDFELSDETMCDLFALGGERPESLSRLFGA